MNMVGDGIVFDMSVQISAFPKSLGDWSVSSHGTRTADASKDPPSRAFPLLPPPGYTTLTPRHDAAEYSNSAK